MTTSMQPHFAKLTWFVCSTAAIALLGSFAHQPIVFAGSVVIPDGAADYSPPQLPTGIGRPIATGSGGSHFKPPALPSGGAPGSRGDGMGSRGGCLAGVPIALVPVYSQGRYNDHVWGETTLERPTIWIYFPGVAPTADPATIQFELTLQDAANQVLYRVPLPLPTKAGMVGIPLPAEQMALEPNQMYHWYIKAQCPATSMQQPASIYVDGWVRRTVPDAALVNQLQSATPEQKFVLYAERGIWYDALNTLAQLRQTRPSDPTIAQDWNELLKAIRLSYLAPHPIVR
ncbi:DUF928 domain-containing protein [Pantanalinema rosaneae CENA516]|uniref:DUF928 domain-containing protein n=1 Tax=Pantanalinema rosaneae TaxID=1620701 RepID=UPI003D6DE19C